MKKIFAVLAALFLLAIVACSSSEGGGNTPTPAASAKEITTFSLGTPSSPGAFSGTINDSEKTIAVTIHSGTNVTALVATFTTTGTSVKVGSNVQTTGETANDFTSAVTYTVTAADASTQNYIVTVTIGDVNQPATALSVSISPPSTTTSSITGSYTVTDPDGGTVIVTEWYDNGVLRQTNTTTLASGVTSGTDTLSGGFSLSHTITFKVTVDGGEANGGVSASTSATVTAPGTTTYSMSGTVSGAVQAGVTITLTGTGSSSTTTDSSGNYSFSGVANGSYTVTPSITGYIFTPANQTVTINGANGTVSNFIASAVSGLYGIMYEALTKTNSHANFISQANTEGTKGYWYKGEYCFEWGCSDTSIYVKNNSQASTYSYEALTKANSSANFITQANTEGAKGYWYKGEYCFDSVCSNTSIYVKNNSQASTYSYEALTKANSHANFITQTNTEGAKGYWYKSEYCFDSVCSDTSIYVKGRLHNWIEVGDFD